jgi:sugar-specific transcriptional regulator TrmB
VDSARKDQIVEALLSYGLNEYEARAYLALLQHGPAVAGEISRRSGIPRPRVYDTLQRLIENSLVAENGGSPRSYAPLPLDDFLARAGAEFRRRQELLRSSLENPIGDTRAEGIFHVHDELPIMRLGEDLIDSAVTRLELRVSGIDLVTWARAIREAVHRGVTVTGGVYGPAEHPPGVKLVERSFSANRTARDARRISIIRDGEDVIIAEVGGIDRPYAIRTRNRLLVETIGRDSASLTRGSSLDPLPVEQGVESTGEIGTA